MRMIVKYQGRSHVRSISEADIAAAYGIEHPDIVVDCRVSREVEVDGALGTMLIESDDWIEVNRIESTEQTEQTEDDDESSEEEGAPAALPDPKQSRDR